MALEPDFLSMTSDTVTLSQASTVSKYGAPTYGDASTAVPTRIERNTHIILDPDGKERVASGTLFILSTTAEVNVGTKITLPDGETPEILRVEALTDDEGLHHTEVTFR